MSFAQLTAPFLPEGPPVDASLAAEIPAITLYDSLCIVKNRAGEGSGRLGERLIVGNEAAVEPRVLEIREKTRG